MENKTYNSDNIAFHDIAVFEDTAWFCNIGYNALFQMDISTGVTGLLAFFPGDSFMSMELYAPIAYLDNKLYIGPRNGKCLLIYDLKDSLFTSIDLDFESYGEEHNYNLFSHAEAIEGKIYFFPGRFHAIVELDPESQSITYIDNWYEELSRNFFEQEKWKLIFNNIHMGANGNCLLPCWRSQEIVKMNVCTREYEILTPIQKPHAPISDAVEIEDNIFFSYKDERGIGDYNKGDFAVLKNTDFQYTEGVFLCALKDWLYIIPLYGNAILRYQFTTGVRENIYQFPENVSAAAQWIPYKNNSLIQKVITDNRLAVFSTFDEKFILVEMETGKIQNVEICLDRKDKKTIQKYLYALMSENVIYESEQYGLKDLLAAINVLDK